MVTAAMFLPDVLFVGEFIKSILGLLGASTSAISPDAASKIKGLI